MRRVHFRSEWRLARRTWARSEEGRWFSRTLPCLSLPVYLGVLFSRDSIRAFSDRIKIRENRGLWTVWCNNTNHFFFVFPVQMIPLFFSLHLSVGRVWRSYDQTPLTSLTEDAPRGEQLYESFYLPEDDTTNGELENFVDFDKRDDDSCVEKTVLRICGGSKYLTVECRSSSLTSCHNAISVYGTRKCKVTRYTVFPECGRTAYPTNCGCAS